MRHQLKINPILFIFSSLLILSCSLASENKQAGQHVAICEEGQGCEFAKMDLHASVVDQLLQRNNYWTNASDSATLIIVNCASEIDEQRSLAEIHQAFGGQGEVNVKSKLNLEKHFSDHQCFLNCANETKKIEYSFSSPEASGNTFFYLNIQKDEAFMPQAAFELYGIPTVDEEGRPVAINQFIKRKGFIDNYLIAGGKKIHTQMSLRTESPEQEKLNYQRFLEDFEKTGNVRKSQNQDEVEYVGKDDEGNVVYIWLRKTADVCVPADKFAIVGFYNLGYLLVDNQTYLITELKGSNFQLKVTSVSDEEYSFDTSGYVSY